MVVSLFDLSLSLDSIRLFLPPPHLLTLHLPTLPSQCVDQSFTHGGRWRLRLDVRAPAACVADHPLLPARLSPAHSSSLPLSVLVLPGSSIHGGRWLLRLDVRAPAAHMADHPLLPSPGLHSRLLPLPRLPPLVQARCTLLPPGAYRPHLPAAVWFDAPRGLHCLFPVFPHWCKLAVLYFLLGLIALIFLLLFVRVAVFGVIWLAVGKRAWFFPSILAEEGSLAELFRFWPDKDDQPPAKITTRLAVAVMLGFTFWLMVTYAPDQEQRAKYQKKVSNIIDDVLQWKPQMLAGKTTPAAPVNATSANQTSANATADNSTTPNASAEAADVKTGATSGASTENSGSFDASAGKEDVADDEPVDPKPEIEEGCRPKCVKQLLAYEACVKRIEGDETGEKHCTGQYFDYWACIDKCRRKWIAEQMHGVQDKRLTEIEKEFQKEQEYFKQTALLSKQQKAKAEAMQSVSFLYMKPPGYNAESARAAELAEEERAKQENEGKMVLEGGGVGEGGGGEGGEGEGGGGEDGGMGADGALVVAEAGTEPPDTDGGKEQKKKKKPRATDVFGRAVPTGDDFEVLKNAPRLDTGIIGRPRPFGLELRNVKCGRCGGIGHSSGERECPLFDSVTENDLKRQQREDPLSHILALNRPQPFGWQLKEQGAGGMSPVRGGFKPNDANQQILPPSDDENEGVFDQYGGFLLGGEADVAALAAGGVGGIGGGGVLMPGLGSSVLDSLTKQQRKELSRALRMKEKEERRKRRKKKERRGGGEGKSKSGREKRRKKEKKKGRGGRRSRHHRRKSDSDSSSDTGSDSSESESDSESSSGDEQTASSSDSSRSESSGSDSSCSDRSKRKRRRGSKRKRSHERKGREKEKQRRREEGGPGPREEKKEETSKSRVESRVEIKIESREIQTGATADAGERHSSRIEDEDGEEKGKEEAGAVDVIAVSPKLPHVKSALERLLKSSSSAGPDPIYHRPSPFIIVQSAASSSPPFESPSSPNSHSASPNMLSPATSSSSDLSSNSTGLDVLAPTTPSTGAGVVDSSMADMKSSVYASDEFRIYSFKVRPCSRAYSHDWTECPFVHPGENARRRDPRKFHYSCVPCPDFRKGSCRRGDSCEYAHGVFECWLHPAQYRTRLCKDGTSCSRRVCFFAHTSEELRPLQSPAAGTPANMFAHSPADMRAVTSSADLPPPSPSSVRMMSQFAPHSATSSSPTAPISPSIATFSASGKCIPGGGQSTGGGGHGGTAPLSLSSG
ncbi:unnamed protein product, partial [Closterium sp. Naga37s-1]